MLNLKQAVFQYNLKKAWRQQQTKALRRRHVRVDANLGKFNHKTIAFNQSQKAYICHYQGARETQEDTAGVYQLDHKDIYSEDGVAYCLYRAILALHYQYKSLDFLHNRIFCLKARHVMREQRSL